MHTPLKYSTEQELRPLRRRRPEAVERWFLEHADAIYTFVYYRLGRDPDSASDVVQETFLTALRDIDDFDPARGKMSTWLTLVSRNCIRRALRQRDRYRSDAAMWDRIDARLAAAYRELETAPLPDEILEMRETADLVRMALSHLPGNYRRALREHYCERRSLREIAASSGTTEGAVKSLLHRARLAFRAAFRTIAESMRDRPSAGRLTP
jgi:RNA polymerase sigma-70 factor (ECF subfamily)